MDITRLCGLAIYAVIGLTIGYFTAKRKGRKSKFWGIVCAFLFPAYIILLFSPSKLTYDDPKRRKMFGGVGFLIPFAAFIIFIVLPITAHNENIYHYLTDENAPDVRPGEYNSNYNAVNDCPAELTGIPSDAYKDPYKYVGNCYSMEMPNEVVQWVDSEHALFSSPDGGDMVKIFDFKHLELGRNVIVKIQSPDQYESASKALITPLTLQIISYQ